MGQASGRGSRLSALGSRLSALGSRGEDGGICRRVLQLTVNPNRSDAPDLGMRAARGLVQSIPSSQFSFSPWAECSIPGGNPSSRSLFPDRGWHHGLRSMPSSPPHATLTLAMPADTSTIAHHSKPPTILVSAYLVDRQAATREQRTVLQGKLCATDKGGAEQAKDDLRLQRRLLRSLRLSPVRDMQKKLDALI